MLNPFKYINKNLNITHESADGYIVRIIENPKQSVSEEEQEKIVADLKSVINSLNLPQLDYGVFKDPTFFLTHGLFTIIYDKATQQPVAFNTQTVMHCTLKGKMTPVYHMGLAIIQPSQQSKGLSRVLYGLTTFLVFFKNRLKPIWVSSVTQVPAAFGSIADSFSDVYPSGNPGERASYDHLQLARQIMNEYRFVFGIGPEANFLEEKFIIENSYTGGSDLLKKTYNDCPKHRNTQYNDFCVQNLNYERGDDYLQIGRITLTTYFQLLIHSLQDNSLSIPLYRFIFAFCESVILPIINWFAVDKQNGVLRPR